MVSLGRRDVSNAPAVSVSKAVHLPNYAALLHYGGAQLLRWVVL
jgi:hypothetical protein